MNSVSNNKFRLKRFHHFVRLTEGLGSRQKPLKILDVGGEEDFWTDKIDLLARPIEITLVNLRPIETLRKEFKSVVASACSMLDFSDKSFDVVHSNSVIEHVGQWDNMRAMAREVRRLAPAYFVQTPYFWFPIEPHFRSVGFHWLPEPVRARRLMSRRHGFVPKATGYDRAMHAVQGSNLLDKRMFSDLFPDGKLIVERVFGLPKSLMIIRGA